MSFPRVRLTINRAEYELLKPGLDFIACQLANAKLGLGTHHHPLVRVDPQLANIYKRKQHSEEGHQAVMSIRAKLWELTSSRKIRASFLELSAAALALRTLHRLPDSKHDPVAVKALASKIEKYRKRAKRSAISRLGKEEYAAATDRWQCFVRWVRYYLIYLHEPKRRSSCRRLTWADQRSSLADLIADILSDLGYAPLSELDMKSVVRLIKEELRRGRHPITLMELLRSTDPADRQFLFHVVAKKCELTPLPEVRYPYDVAASMRAEKFKNRNRHRTSGPAEVPAALAESGIDGEYTASPKTAGQSSSRPLNLTEAVANWFREHVNRAQWNAVGSLALTQVIYAPPSHVTVPPAASLAELISKTGPARCLPGSCYPVRDLATWLLRWLYACIGLHGQVMAALRLGYNLATEHGEARTA
jgi:hypothetical protein